MPRFISKFLLCLVMALGLLGVFGIDAVPAFAQEATDTLAEVNETAGLGENDIKQTIASIIRIVLGFLGILAVVIVLYGGFTWMTAGGNEEKLERAKKILIRGVIGLIIVMLSYAIASFIISAILGATQGGNGGSGSGGGSGGTSLGGGRTSSFVVTDFSPEGAVSIRNVQPRITFSKNVDEETVDGNITITNKSTGETVSGSYSVSGNKVSFVPSTACPSPNEDRFCFDADTEFTVSIDGDIESSNGTALVCSGDTCTSSFTTGSLVDTEDPEVTFSEPQNSDGIPTESVQLIQVLATDDSEVSGADFAAEDEIFDSVGAIGDDLSEVTIESIWDTSGIANGEKVRLSATVTDIAGNTSDDAIGVSARPAWCFNGELDSDLGETGIDCGGDSSSDDYCGACDGSSCTDDSECSSGACIDGACVSLPEIESISPGNGAPSTFVTISGSGFGTTEGTVTFAAADGGTVEATIPACGDGWTSTQIIVQVPETAIDGPITLTTDDGESDATDDDAGPILDNFDVNSVMRPNLCLLSPDQGEVTDGVTITGTGFGDSQGESTVYFGTAEAGSYTSWTSESVGVTVAAVDDGSHDVRMVVDGVESNALTFTVEEDVSDAPTIAQIDPATGAIGDYVTITGTNFGALTGTVWFVSEESGESALALTNFPDECAEDFWDTEEVTVIVPNEFSGGTDVIAGDYTVYVMSQDGEESNSVDFTITDGEPAPGICAVDPDTGEAGDAVTIYGERLGSTEGTVTFYNDVAATIVDEDDSATDGWSSDSITVTVPTGVVTGPVTVTSSDGDESNSVDFAVGEGTEAAAAAAPATYGWYFSTGDIPSAPEVVVECSDTTVSAVPNETFTSSVCTNAVVYAEFSTLMNEATIDDALSVEKCTAGGDRPCTTTEDVSGSLEVASSTATTYFTFTPDTLDVSSTYRVTISTAATSAASGTGNSTALADEVSWEFTTKSTDEACGVERVVVRPDDATIDTQYGTESFHALPSTGCVITDPDDYSWDWAVDESYAGLQDTPDDDECQGGTTSCTYVIGNAEGVSEVEAMEMTSLIDGTGDLTINFTDPYVEYYQPNCTEACRDAVVSATFNTVMSELSVETPGNVLLYECANELCVNLEEADSYTVFCDTEEDTDTERCSEVEIDHDDLELGTYYRVVISGGVTSYSGVPLTRTNYSGDFSWIFQVKADDTACAVERLTITPDAATAVAVDESQAFEAHAFGSPDSCSVAGQELQSTAYSWSWTNPIADDAASIEIAQWWRDGDADSDVEGIEAGCTASCIAGGSEAYAAICGDSSVDDGEDCDDGNAVSGDGCSSSCLNEGTNACSMACTATGTTCTANSDCAETCNTTTLTCTISGSACATDADCSYASDTCGFTGTGCCGNGAKESNEECDDGDATSGDGCSSSCLNEGSSSVDAVCGNGSIAHDDAVGGEECEDDDARNGDGCSSQCLNEGSPTLVDVGGAVCGNGVLDTPYETCDTALAQTAETASGTQTGQIGEGCSDRCLLEGPSALYSVPSDCGDGYLGIGEECEDDNEVSGDGCSAECLYEGSSLSYDEPSLCGDGILGTGELEVSGAAACESAGGDSYVDSLQLASITEEAAEGVDPDTNTAIASIEVEEPTSGIRATATYTLECSALNDEDCPNPETYGHGENNCCFERPMPTFYPIGGDTCRNSAVYAEFDSRMSLESFMKTNSDQSEQPRMYAVLDLAASGLTECPSDHTELARAPSRWLARTVYNARQFIMGIPVRAATDDCVVPVSSFRQVEQSSGSFRVYMEYESALAANATYTLVVESDADYSDATVDGVTTAYGVGLYLEGETFYSEEFITGNDVCVLDEVQVEDTDDDSPYYFSQGGEEHRFMATAVSHTMLDNGQEITPISGVYEWEWTAWDDERNGDVVQVSQDSTTTSEADVAAVGDNGDTTVTATATITVDDLGTTEGYCSVTTSTSCNADSDCPSGEACAEPADAIVGTADVTAYLCENSWPELEVFPWQDNATGGANGNAFESDRDGDGVGDDDWMNFSTYYCRDAGTDGANGYCSVTTADSCESDADCPDAETCVGDTTADEDDLPAVDVVLASVRASVTDDVVMKEYLLEVAGSSDAIGIRIVKNSDYLSPTEWFEEQGFSGQPQETTVDGFAAVTDGRTTYIAAPNESATGDLYSNIYVISYNEGADNETIDIYEQLLENFSFATNVDDTALCYTSAGALATDTSGDSISCEDDNDCTANAGDYCGDMKAKLRRDTRRLSDLKDIVAAVEAFGTESGQCSDTTSQSCESDSDCPTGESCEAISPSLSSGTYIRGLGASAWTSWEDVLGDQLAMTGITDPLNGYVDCGDEDGVYADYDSATCVNQMNGQYACPDGSHVYHYRAIGEQSYALYADLEYDGGDWVNALDDDTTDAATIWAGGASSTATADGFTSALFCDGDVYGSTGSCGDGVINTSIDSDGDGVADTAETCEIGERGGSSTACTDDDGNSGSVSQVCNSSCTGWEDDADAVCVATSCGDGIVQSATEDCDDGVMNGRYGYCSSTCGYDDAMVCGDGKLQGGEACDCGSASMTDEEFALIEGTARPYSGTAGACTGVNGTYDETEGLTCAWDCRGAASFCGDTVVDSAEQCDTESESWEGALCGDGVTQCETDDDCSEGDTCGDVHYACPVGNVCTGGSFDGMLCNGTNWSEIGVDSVLAGGADFVLYSMCLVGADGNYSTTADNGTCLPDASPEYQTFRTRSCNDTTSTDACSYDSWSYCNRDNQLCGNGTVEGDEECDDGNDDSTDSCTAYCTANVCGDGYLYVGEEQCDEGADNGDSCSANYESSCTACSTSCRYEVSSGEFCGDGDINASEYCDAYDIPYMWLDAYGVDAGTCDSSRVGQYYATVYGANYAYTDGTDYSTNPICANVGICNGGSDNGDYCDADSDCDSGQCVLPTCAASCASTCPFTYDDTSMLATTNAVGADPEESISIYPYSSSSTSDLPNAATITIPACDAISSITADVSMDEVEPPTTYVLFITDLSHTMKWEAPNDSDPDDTDGDGDVDELSRLAIAQNSMEDAIEQLYDELPGDTHIGAIGFKGLVAGDCYYNGDPNTSTGDGSACTAADSAGDDYCAGLSSDYPDDFCVDTTSELSSTAIVEPYGNYFDFVQSDEESDVVAEIVSYFVDPEWYSETMTTGHGTFTREALVEARYMFGSTGFDPLTDNVRFIAVLLSDGEYTSTDPLEEAREWDYYGYELYTATIGADADFIAQMNNWSSNNYYDADNSGRGDQTTYASNATANSLNGIDYSYVGDTEDEIEEMYEQIIDSILGVQVTLISSDDSDTDSTAESDTLSVREGMNVELPWPTGFVCDPSAEQDLPIRVNFAGEGQVEISNIRVNYCAP